MALQNKLLRFAAESNSSPASTATTRVKRPHDDVRTSSTGTAPKKLQKVKPSHSERAAPAVAASGKTQTQQQPAKNNLQQSSGSNKLQQVREKVRRNEMQRTEDRLRYISKATPETSFDQDDFSDDDYDDDDNNNNGAHGPVVQKKKPQKKLQKAKRSPSEPAAPAVAAVRRTQTLGTHQQPAKNNLHQSTGSKLQQVREPALRDNTQWNEDRPRPSEDRRISKATPETSFDQDDFNSSVDDDDDDDDNNTAVQRKQSSSGRNAPQHPQLQVAAPENNNNTVSAGGSATWRALKLVASFALLLAVILLLSKNPAQLALEGPPSPDH